MHGIATLMPWNMFITANSVSETKHDVLIFDKSRTWKNHVSGDDIAMKDLSYVLERMNRIRFFLSLADNKSHSQLLL